MGNPLLRRDLFFRLAPAPAEHHVRHRPHRGEQARHQHAGQADLATLDLETHRAQDEQDRQGAEHGQGGGAQRHPERAAQRRLSMPPNGTRVNPEYASADTSTALRGVPRWSVRASAAGSRPSCARTSGMREYASSSALNSANALTKPAAATQTLSQEPTTAPAI